MRQPKKVVFVLPTTNLSNWGCTYNNEVVRLEFEIVEDIK